MSRTLSSRTICKRCTRPGAECFCHLVRPLDNRWPVVILQHTAEAEHPLNTARIAQLCLQRCTTLTVQDGSAVDVPAELAVPSPQPVLIYPGQGSRPLAELAPDMPVPLVFIDASWRKSYRLLQEHQWLKDLPRYHVETAAPSRYRIRREPKPGYLSTLETIVEVLAAREAVPVPDMLAIMDWIVDGQIASMGRATWERNYRA